MVHIAWESGSVDGLEVQYGSTPGFIIVFFLV